MQSGFKYGILFGLAWERFCWHDYVLAGGDPVFMGASVDQQTDETLRGTKWTSTTAAYTLTGQARKEGRRERSLATLYLDYRHIGPSPSVATRSECSSVRRRTLPGQKLEASELQN
jgi:hypothetical protein